MKTYLTRPVPLVATIALALGFLALGFLAALGVRSLVGTASASPDAPNPGHLWTELEDHGIDGGDYWLGTTVDQALELRVNGQRALRLEPDATSPNVIGGYAGNAVTDGVWGAAIGGGGAPDDGGGSPAPNRVTGRGGTVGGGGNNQAGSDSGTTGDAWFATVAGGWSNTAGGPAAAICGGSDNTASADWATVAGGYGNDATDDYGTVGGGENNQAGDNAGTSSDRPYATVAGGHDNTASGPGDAVGGGFGNTADGSDTTIGGGHQNSASGPGATVPGGMMNVADGAYAFAAGRRAQANHGGTFVWADSNDFDFASTAANEFGVRSTGGARFVLAIDGSGSPTWTCSVSNGGTWGCSSARSLKENLVAADGLDILERLSEVPVFTWNAKDGDPSVRHIGPMAGDFYGAFGVGEDETQLSTIDLDGVALASIQGLYELVQEAQAENAALAERLAEVEQAGSVSSASSQGSSSGMSAVWLVVAGLLGGLVVGTAVLVWRRVMT